MASFVTVWTVASVCQVAYKVMDKHKAYDEISAVESQFFYVKFHSISLQFFIQNIDGK